MGQLELALLLARVLPRTTAHVYVSPAVERHLPEGARREPRRSSRQAQRRRKIGCEVAVRPLRKVIDGAAIAVAWAPQRQVHDQVVAVHRVAGPAHVLDAHDLRVVDGADEVHRRGLLDHDAAPAQDGHAAAALGLVSERQRLENVRAARFVRGAGVEPDQNFHVAKLLQLVPRRRVVLRVGSGHGERLYDAVIKVVSYSGKNVLLVEIAVVAENVGMEFGRRGRALVFGREVSEVTGQACCIIRAGCVKDIGRDRVSPASVSPRHWETPNHTHVLCRLLGVEQYEIVAQPARVQQAYVVATDRQADTVGMALIARQSVDVITQRARSPTSCRLASPGRRQHSLFAGMSSENKPYARDRVVLGVQDLRPQVTRSAAWSKCPDGIKPFDFGFEEKLLMRRKF